MENYLENSKYKSRLEKMSARFSKERVIFILNIIKNMVEIKTEIKIRSNDLCAIIDKLIDPEISYSDISAFNYMYAVKLWNSYIQSLNTNQFLLINTTNVVY